MTKAEKRKYHREYLKNNPDKAKKYDETRRIYAKERNRKISAMLKEKKAQEEAIREVHGKFKQMEEPPADSVQEAQEQPIPEVQEVPPQPAETPQEAQEQPNEEQQGKTTKDFFASLKRDYKKEEKPEGEKKDEQKQDVPIGEEIKIDKKIPNAETKTLITGYLFLLAVNSVYPDVLVWFLSMISKKYRGIKSDNLNLGPDELAQIEPIADEVVRIYLPQINPLALLFICMNAMYFQKIKAEIKRNPPKRKMKIK